jgi:hypothetical protein
MEKLADLPPAALITFGIALAVIIAVQRFGLWQGKTGGASGSDKAVVASVIVDPTALNRASSAGEALAEALRAYAKLADDHTHMLCRRVEGLTDAVEGQMAATNALILEMARRSGK